MSLREWFEDQPADIEVYLFNWKDKLLTLDPLLWGRGHVHYSPQRRGVVSQCLCTASSCGLVGWHPGLFLSRSGCLGRKRWYLLVQRGVVLGVLAGCSGDGSGHAGKWELTAQTERSDCPDAHASLWATETPQHCLLLDTKDSLLVTAAPKILTTRAPISVEAPSTNMATKAVISVKAPSTNMATRALISVEAPSTNMATRALISVKAPSTSMVIRALISVEAPSTNMVTRALMATRALISVEAPSTNMATCARSVLLRLLRCTFAISLQLVPPSTFYQSGAQQFFQSTKRKN